MQEQEYVTTAIDRAAMALGAGLMFLGIIGLGIVEILDGPPYGAAPMTNDAGTVIATPLVDPALRTGLVIAGLVVLLVWQCYRMAATPAHDETAQQVDVTAD